MRAAIDANWLISIQIEKGREDSASYDAPSSVHHTGQLGQQEKNTLDKKWLGPITVIGGL